METKDKIKILREALKLTQAGFGKEVGVAGGYVGMIERATKTPSLKLLRQLQSHFKVNMVWWETGAGEIFEDKFKQFAALREAEGLKRQENTERGADRAKKTRPIPDEIEDGLEGMSTEEFYRIMAIVAKAIDDLKKQREDGTL